MEPSCSLLKKKNQRYIAYLFSKVTIWNYITYYTSKTYELTVGSSICLLLRLVLPSATWKIIYVENRVSGTILDT
jgi:hypothetical protein